jgi:hypothetical protein
MRWKKVDRLIILAIILSRKSYLIFYFLPECVFPVTVGIISNTPVHVDGSASI